MKRFVSRLISIAIPLVMLLSAGSLAAAVGVIGATPS
jgi:hypothetical protein